MGAKKPWMVRVPGRGFMNYKKKKKKKKKTNPAQKSQATRKHQEPRKTERQGLRWCSVAGTAGSKARGPGVIPGQGTRSHTPKQESACHNKDRYSQINK